MMPDLSKIYHKAVQIFRNTIYLIMGSVLAYTSAGCEKNIDIDIDEIETMIVLNGVLAEGESVQLYLSRTRHILDNMQITAIKDATVEIVDADGLSDTLVYGEDQLYRAGSMTIAPGKTYTVKASAPGYERITATSRIPEPVSIVRLDTTSSVDEWGEQMFDFTVVFDDPPTETNYYMLSVSSHYEISYIEYDYTLDTLYVDTEKDTVVMGYRRDSVEYIDVRNESTWFESENLAIENEDNYQSRILFSDKLFDGKRYSITGRFYPWFLWDANDSATVYFSLRAIDEHYYRYIDSRADHYYAKNDPFAVPVVVHSNIENGLGILGGMAVATDSVKLAPRRWEWDSPRLIDKIPGK